MQAGNTPHQAAFALSAAAAPLGMLVALDTVTVLLPHTALAGAVMSIRRTTGAKPADPAPLVVPPGSTGQDPGTPLASLHPVGPPPALTADAQALVDQVITPLFEEAATGRRQTITWSRTCLFWGDQPGEPVPRIIDLAGPGRVLAYGPYFHLPRGGWTVRAVLAFSSTAIGVPLAVELHGDGLLGRGRLTPGQAGVFAASFPADVGSPAIPIEVRVISEAGAIDGKIGVDHVALIPRP